MILTRYVMSHVIWSVLGVLSVIVAVDIIFAFFDELGNLQDNYTFLDALIYSFAFAPVRFVEFTSVSTLIGCLVGLGVLASNSELVVMRAASIGMVRIVSMVCLASIVISTLSLVVAEVLVPKVALFAESYKSAKVGFYGKYDQGVWLRDSEDFIYVNRLSPKGEIKKMNMFRPLDGGQMKLTSVAEGIYLPQQKQWQLHDVRSTQIDIDNKTLSTHSTAELLWNASVSPRELMLLQLKPENLSITGLFDYKRYLQNQGLNNERYNLMFWKLILQPLANFVMVLLAASMVFGSMRAVSMGYRITLGLIYGLSFYYLQEVFGFLSLVYGLHPLVSLMIPLSVFIGFAVVRLRAVG